MLASLARTVARRHRAVLAGALLVFVALTAFGIGAFPRLLTGGQTDPTAPSSRAEAVVDHDLGGQPGLVVLVTSHSGRIDTPAGTAAGRAVTAALEHDRSLSQVSSWFTTPDPALISRDGISALAVAHVAGDDTQARDAVKALTPSLQAAAGPAVAVRIGGRTGTDAALTKQIAKDLLLVSLIAVPITVLLLFAAFRGLVAALLPLATGVLTIMGTFAVLRGLSYATSVSTYAIDLTIALGLGLSVDYGLLLTSRYREALALGAEPIDAVAQAAATAGRTVVFSGLTVGVALTALLVFPLYFLRSFAYAGIAVVVLSVLGALIVTPALLAALGGRVGRSLPDPGGSSFWRSAAAGATRRPALAIAGVGLVLLVVGMPLLGVHFTTPDDRVLPASAPTHQVGDALRTSFTSNTSSVIEVVSTSAGGDASETARLRSLPGVTGVQGPLGRGDAIWMVDTGLAPTSGAAQALVRDIRAEAPVLVGGPAADLIDQEHSITASLPLAGAILVIATFLLLFLFTGSVVIPVKALALNALTLFAVVGAMVWAFQDGHLAGLLGFTPTPTTTTMPPLLFVVAFGLSMDYEVFVLSRIKELHDSGVAARDAVVDGLARTGGLITTAAALLSVTFFAFGASKVSFLQFFGVGTGLAILLDAVVVRGVLVPAVMGLAGERIWWAPRPLERLHRRIGLSEVPTPAGTSAG